MVTDRDIVVPAMARSLDGRSTSFSDAMSANVRCATLAESLGEISSPAAPDRNG